VDRLEVALRGDREPGLDHVDAHGLQDLGDAELLVDGHRAAGRLLPVAQGGVEDDDAVPCAGAGPGLTLVSVVMAGWLTTMAVAATRAPLNAGKRPWLRGR
jgi:hypothetical protein